MLRLVGALIGVAAMAAGGWLKAGVGAHKVFRWWRRNEIGKRILGKETTEETSERLQYEVTEDEPVLKYLKSRTMQGLIASGVAGGLALIMGDADAATLAPQVVEWVLNGVQLGGLIWAARGRKLAQGPL